MSGPFTPDTRFVRGAYTYDREENGAKHPLHPPEEEFDRWLAAHDAEVIAAHEPVIREREDEAVLKGFELRKTTMEDAWGYVSIRVYSILADAFDTLTFWRKRTRPDQ